MNKSLIIHVNGLNDINLYLVDVLHPSEQIKEWTKIHKIQSLSFNINADGLLYSLSLLFSNGFSLETIKPPDISTGILIFISGFYTDFKQTPVISNVHILKKNNKICDYNEDSLFYTHICLPGVSEVNFEYDVTKEGLCNLVANKHYGNEWICSLPEYITVYVDGD